MMKISDRYKVVKGVLCSDKRTRDNDHLLSVIIWHKQLKASGHDITKMSAYDFMLLSSRQGTCKSRHNNKSKKKSTRGQQTP